MAIASAHVLVSPKIRHGAVPDWDFDLDNQKRHCLRYDGKNVFRVRNQEDVEQVDSDEVLIRQKIHERWGSRLGAYRALKAASTSQFSYMTPAELTAALKKTLDFGFLGDARILAVMNRWDVNQDNVLDWEEFSAAIKTEEANRNYTHFGGDSYFERSAVKPTDEEGGTAQHWLTESQFEERSRVKIDPVGRLDMILSVLKRKISERYQHQRTAFLSFDQGREGFISPANWRRVLSNNTLALGFEVTSEEIDALFAVFDRSGRGAITFQEFVNELVCHDSCQYARPSQFVETHDGRQQFSLSPAHKNLQVSRKPADWRDHHHLQEKKNVLRENW